MRHSWYLFLLEAESTLRPKGALYDAISFYNIWASAVDLRVVCKAMSFIPHYVRALWNSQTIMQYDIWHSFFIVPSLNICLRVWNHVLFDLLYTNVTVFRLLHKTAKSDSSLRHVCIYLVVWKGQLVSHWMNFHILYLRIFQKSLDNITVPLKSDKIDEYFTWIPMYVHENISQNYSYNDNFFVKILYKKLK